MTEPVLDAQGLGQRLGGRWVYKNAALTVAAGEVVLMSGPNGCGKTTLLRQFATLLLPTRGTVQVMGHDTKTDKLKSRAHAAFMAAYPALYEDLTVRENLTLFTTARRGTLRPEDLAAQAEALGLKDRLNQRVHTLSSGLKKRTALCLMALSGTALWLLDEPETTLDPSGTAWLRQTLRAHTQNGGAAVIATHQPGAFGELHPTHLTLTPKGLTPVEALHA